MPLKFVDERVVEYLASKNSIWLQPEVFGILEAYYSGTGIYSYNALLNELKPYIQISRANIIKLFNGIRALGLEDKSPEPPKVEIQRKKRGRKQKAANPSEQETQQHVASKSTKVRKPKKAPEPVPLKKPKKEVHICADQKRVNNIDEYFKKARDLVDTIVRDVSDVTYTSMTDAERSKLHRATAVTHELLDIINDSKNYVFINSSDHENYNDAEDLQESLRHALPYAY